MKKLNFVIFGALLAISLATQAFAETTIPWTKEGCESVKGTWLTAHSPDDNGCDAAHCNGLNFCQSNVSMNWWSALIWCKSIGRKLAEVETACPNALASGGACANFKEMYSSWLNMPSSGGSAYYIATGRVSTTDRSRTTRPPTALCQ